MATAELLLLVDTRCLAEYMYVNWGVKGRGGSAYAISTKISCSDPNVITI